MAILFLGTYKIFNCRTRCSNSRIKMLEVVVKGTHSQTLYNYAMTLIVFKDNQRFSILESMLK